MYRVTYAIRRTCSRLLTKTNFPFSLVALVSCNSLKIWPHFVIFRLIFLDTNPLTNSIFLKYSIIPWFRQIQNKEKSIPYHAQTINIFNIENNRKWIQSLIYREFTILPLYPQYVSYPEKIISFNHNRQNTKTHMGTQPELQRTHPRSIRTFNIGDAFKSGVGWF